MTARTRSARPARVLGVAGGLALGLALGLAAPPAGAAGPSAGWTLDVDPHPEVEAARTVTVTGRVDVPLGGVIGILDAPRSVTVSLVPTAEGVPAACTTPEMTRTVVPSRNRYSAEVTAACNGPHRIEVTAVSRNGLRSGAPAVGEVRVADPGPAPSAPRVVGTVNGVVVAWDPASSPDVVGWTVTGGLAPVGLDAATTAATIPADPGQHRVALVARRWGADGPGGPEVASPAAEADAVTVTAPQVDLDEDSPSATVPARPPEGPSSRSAVTVPSEGTSAPATGGRSRPARRPPTSTPSGYREDLPYGVPDEAFRPGAAPAGTDTAPDGADGDDERAGTTPRASWVRTREATSPGLVAPVALAVLLGTVATHIGWYLRRSRPNGVGQGSPS